MDPRSNVVIVQMVSSSTCCRPSLERRRELVRSSVGLRVEAVEMTLCSEHWKGRVTGFGWFPALGSLSALFSAERERRGANKTHRALRLQEKKGKKNFRKNWVMHRCMATKPASGQPRLLAQHTHAHTHARSAVLIRGPLSPNQVGCCGCCWCDGNERLHFLSITVLYCTAVYAGRNPHTSTMRRDGTCAAVWSRSFSPCVSLSDYRIGTTLQQSTCLSVSWINDDDDGWLYPGVLGWRVGGWPG